MSDRDQVGTGERELTGAEAVAECERVTAEAWAMLDRVRRGLDWPPREVPATPPE